MVEFQLTVAQCVPLRLLKLITKLLAAAVWGPLTTCAVLASVTKWVAFEPRLASAFRDSGLLALLVHQVPRPPALPARLARATERHAGSGPGLPLGRSRAARSSQRAGGGRIPAPQTPRTWRGPAAEVVLRAPGRGRGSFAQRERRRRRRGVRESTPRRSCGTGARARPRARRGRAGRC